MKDIHNLRIQIIFMFLSYIFFTTGCAKDKVIGVRTFKHDPELIGTVEEFVQYFPITIQRYPTDENPELIVQLTKEIKNKKKYQTETHDEIIYIQEIGPLDKEGQRIVKSIKVHPLAGLFELAISPLNILFDSIENRSTEKKIRYEKIPGSERTNSYYEFQAENKPGNNEYITIDEIGETITDKNGIAAFENINPAMFDNGLKLSVRRGETYIITRERRIKRSEADWYKVVKTSHDLYSTFKTVYTVGKKIKKVGQLSGGLPSIAVGIVFDIVTGKAVGYIIDTLGTKTEEYHRWSLVLLPT